MLARGSTKTIKRLVDTQSSVLSNTLWQLGARWSQFVLSAGMNIWVARHLGPHDFGLLAYALALATVLQLVSKAGAEMHIKSAVVRGGPRARRAMGSGLWLRIIGCGVIYTGLITYIALADLERPQALLLLLAGGVIISSITDIFQCYYASVFKARVTALAGVIGTLLSIAIRGVAIVFNFPLWAFALASAVELVVAGIVVTAIFRLDRPITLDIRPSLKWMRYTFLRSLPLYVSALAVSVYLRVDHLMIEGLVGEVELGLYAAASRLAERLHLIPVAVGATCLPLIITQRRLQNSATRIESMQRYYDLNVGISLCLIVGYFSIGQHLVSWALGPEYERSVSILSILIFTLPPMALGVSLGQYIVAEGWYRYAMISNSLGALINVVLNWMLIPMFGGAGAAWSTFASYLIMHIGFTLLYRPTRKWGVCQVRALLLPFRLRAVLALMEDLCKIIRTRIGARE